VGMTPELDRRPLTGGPEVTEADHTSSDVEVLQEATRLLAGVALRSVEVLHGAVTLPQYRALAVLADLGEVRSARVADALGLEASTVTRLVDRLAAAGHVSRSSDPTNRSAVTLQLTASGRALVEQVVSWRHRELKRILLCLTPADRVALTSSLALLVDVAGEGYGARAVHRLPL
jgi:DNA-binding MarR family transcriptional regulator